MKIASNKLTSKYSQSRKSPLRRLEHFYYLAKHQAWNVDDLNWGQLPPVPGFNKEKWHLLWASVVQQQLQADLIAIEAAKNLLLQVSEREAKLYYMTMLRDESCHVEGWTRLNHMLDDVEARNPYLAEMGIVFMKSETLEERVIAFQVCFEGCAIHAFKMIARVSQGTLLGQMASKLVCDDAIHHSSGVSYAQHLLRAASPALKKQIDVALKRYVNLYTKSILWRPPVRRWLSKKRVKRDMRVLQYNHNLINKSVTNLGLAPLFDL